MGNIGEQRRRMELLPESEPVAATPLRVPAELGPDERVPAARVPAERTTANHAATEYALPPNPAR